MFVIVNIQGQQFRVEKDQKLYVHRLEGEEGAEIEFDKVLLADNDGEVTVGTPVIEGAKVVAEIINPLVKGDKVLVFHKKRRKGYRKLNGHRQQFSQILIKDIQA
jgi:large subunit ribosomal protein L21